MPSEDETWNFLRVRLARDAEELVVSELFDSGATGTIVLRETAQEVEIGAYFASDISLEDVIATLKERLLKATLTGSLHESELGQVQGQDWLEKWKEGFDPVEVGERLLIAPSWRIDDLISGVICGTSDGWNETGHPILIRDRIVIQIDPGMAFGTGTHETTRLCLEAIERNWKGGKFLDVGTGTGILAIAAAVLVAASEIVAVDIDPVAVDIARQNLAVNHLTRVEVFQGLASQWASRDFDVVVANLTAGVIVDNLESLAGAVKPSGCLILSGILTEQAADVTRALNLKGLPTVERSDAGEWACLVARISGA